MYHHRVHGPERAPPSPRVARSPGDRRAGSAAHRDSGRRAGRSRSTRPRRAVGHGRRLRGRIAACRWSPHGALEWARCRAADGRWIGVEPGAIEHAAWGRSDRVWLLDREDPGSEEPWRPVEPLTVFRALDW